MSQKARCGYPSLTFGVIAMTARGAPIAEAAEMLRASKQSLRVMRFHARRNGTAMGLLLKRPAYRALAEQALRRGIPDEVLAARILETVTQEGLVDAVLDDIAEEAA